jgi:beta-lactamase regulating signal transducer with metallopeptidase domain
MNSFYTYLVELNISLMILFVAYKLFFEKDKNFVIRRIYLLGVAVMPLVLPILPASLRMPAGSVAPISITLEEVTIFGSGSQDTATASLSFGSVLWIIYLIILGLGLIKVFIQLAKIVHAILISPRFEAQGTSLLASKNLHASSFFGFVFIDPDKTGEDSFQHILEHESIHKREWHSIDRILVEVFVMLNWFNPVAWMLRKSVIQNLEFLADSAVLRKGTDPMKYQLSILNQYIGSASLSNQFSSQIKNRINMLNRDYKLGSRWKVIMLLPLSLIAFFIVSCTDKDAPLTEIDAPEAISAEVSESAEPIESEVFYIVEEMPAFKGDKEAIEFRKYIAQNLKYPPEAADAGVTGKIFTSFIVTKEGKVIIPEKEVLAKAEGKALDEVVVVAYRSIQEDTEMPDEKYIQMLKDEAVRVISSCPDWEPGKQRGQAVNVMFTFPITFRLQ